MSSSFICNLFLSAWFLTQSAWAGMTMVLPDSYVLIGREYGSKGVPCPMQGIWGNYFIAPQMDPEKNRIEIKWRSLSKENVEINYAFFTSEGRIDLVAKIDLNDWSNGMLSAERRAEEVKNKTLLHFDKSVMPVVSGELPENIEITKYVIGRRGDEDVCIVVYKSKNLDLLKKYFRMTEQDFWNLGDRKWFEKMY